MASLFSRGHLGNGSGRFERVDVLIEVVGKTARFIEADIDALARGAVSKPREDFRRQLRQQRARQDLLDIARAGRGFGTALGDDIDQLWIVAEVDLVAAL